MKIYQLYYTSCKKGLTSGMGFQTYSMSEGVTEEERQEIEKHCVYVEPRSLPSSPSLKEIEELFPIAFSFFRLKSGRYCICRTKYKGRDYSGRFGNYFSHALIWEGEPSFYPIELYNSKVFKEGLTDKEESSEVINPLPILEELPREGFIGPSDIEDFLKQNSSKKRTKSLNELIDSIFDGKKNDKKIVFSDDISNLHMWIAAATMAFPRAMAKDITFNTYSFDGENSSEFLCGISSEASELKKSHKGYRFNVLNLKEDNELPLKTKFAKQASLEYTILKSYREEIIGFIELFNYEKIDINIDNCVNLYSIVNNGLQKISYEDAAKAIDFANEYGREAALEKIMSKIDNEALNKITSNLNINMAEVIFKFLFRISKITGKEEYMTKAYEFFFNSMHFMIVDGEDIEIQNIIKLYEEMRNYNKESPEAFLAKSLEEKRLSNAAVYLEGGKPRHAAFYLCSVMGDLMALGGRPWEKLGEAFKKFIESCLKVLLQDGNSLKYALKYICNSPEYFSNTVNLAWSVSHTESEYINLIICYSDILSQISFYKASDIRKNLLKKKDGIRISMFAFKYNIRNSKDKLTYFMNYCNNVFDDNILYREKAFSSALGELIKGFKAYDFNLNFYEVLLSYVKSRGMEKSIGEENAKVLALEFQNAVPVEIPKEDIEKAITEISNIKRLYKINVKPYISEIPCFAKRLEEEELSIEEFLCSERDFDFNGVSREKYDEILKLMFKIICPKLKDILAHLRLKRIFLYKDYTILYFNNYTASMETIFDAKGSNEIYLDFICFILKVQSLFSEEQFALITENIIGKLKKIDLVKLDEYDSYITRVIKNTVRGEEKISMNKEWQKIYSSSEKLIKGKSILNKIRRSW